MTEPSAPPTPNQPPLRLHARRWLLLSELLLLAAMALAYWLAWKPLEAAFGSAAVVCLLVFIGLPMTALARIERHHFQQRVRAARCAGQAVDERDVLYLFPPDTVRNYKLPGPDAHPTGFVVRAHFRAAILEFASWCLIIPPLLSITLPAALVPVWWRGLTPWLCILAVWVLLRSVIRWLNTRELPGPTDCQHCGYRAVRALESRRCPECGMAVEDGPVHEKPPSVA